jgi:hypothetical protein
VLLDFRPDVIPNPEEGKSRRNPFELIPVRIRIGDADLLGYVEETEHEPPEWRWARLGVLDVAKWGLLSIRRARETGRYVYELGPYGDTGSALLFKTLGDDMLIHSTMTERTARISYDRLAEAWEEFAERVREYTIKDFPAMTNEPGWGEWLAGNPDTSWHMTADLLFPSWRRWFEAYPNAFEHVDSAE